jgi:hypothetical protein
MRDDDRRRAHASWFASVTTRAITDAGALSRYDDGSAPLRGRRSFSTCSSSSSEQAPLRLRRARVICTSWRRNASASARETVDAALNRFVSL